MEIKKDFKNDLMNRREIHFAVESSITPSFADASKMIAEQFKCSEDQIMVESVNGKFGRNEFLINASIYDTKELKEEAVKRLTKQKKEKPAA